MNVTKTIFAGLLAVSSVFALPTLQLDMSGGTYDALTETVINTSNQFDLVALLNSEEYTGNYYVSMALTPQISMQADIGSFVFGTETIDISKMEFGTPPVDLADLRDLPSHGIFPTYFIERSFTFSSGNKALNYNVEDAPGGLVIDGNGGLYYKTFSIDITNLNPNYGIHFDLYNEEFKKNGETNLGFAPFSHDAEASYVTENVPEPATLSLFGMGLLALSGIGLFSRRK